MNSLPLSNLGSSLSRVVECFLPFFLFDCAEALLQCRGGRKAGGVALVAVLLRLSQHCYAWPYLPVARGILVPQPGNKPASPALEGRFLTTGKSLAFKKKKVISLFLAALGLPCFERAFSSCGKWGPTLHCSAQVLTAVASLVAE